MKRNQKSITENMVKHWLWIIDNDWLISWIEFFVLFLQYMYSFILSAYINNADGTEQFCHKWPILGLITAKLYHKTKCFTADNIMTMALYMYTIKKDRNKITGIAL